MRLVNNGAIHGTKLGPYVVVAAAVLALGCREELGRGPNPCNAEACDVLERDCQRRAMAVLHCFRGGDDDELPDVDVITEEEYIELIQGDELTDDERATYERFARGMSLFKLSPEVPDLETDLEEYAAEIAAAYLTEDKRVVIIERDDPSEERDSYRVFVHELVHALQDREVDLTEVYGAARPTLDGTLAARALIEGEAAHYEMLVAAALDGIPPQYIDYGFSYASYQISMLKAGYEDDAPLLLSLVRFPYAFGGDYVAQKWLGGGQRAIARSFEEPPLSAVDVLQYKPPSDEKLEDIAEFREVSRLAAIEGYEHVAYDELGSFILDGFLHRQDLTDDNLLDLRVLWLVADGATVLQKAEGDHLVAAWRLRFQSGKVPSEESLEAWREALGAADEASPEPGDDVTARVYAEGNDLVIIASDAPLDAAFLGDDVAWEPAPSDKELGGESLPSSTIRRSR